MTIARAHLVDPSVTRWYHCVTRCVRRAFLLGEGMHNRKSWIGHRLEELAEIFSVAVAGFAILDNHLHLLVRLDPDVALGWSDKDVVRRWGRLFPPRDKARQVAPVSEEWVQARLKDARWVATARAGRKRCREPKNDFLASMYPKSVPDTLSALPVIVVSWRPGWQSACDRAHG